MPGKLDVYNLGEVGVDLVESPLHKKDGAFLSAQNAAHKPIEAEGGIVKRRGMTKLNTVTASTPIWSICLVSLADPNAADAD